MSTEAEAVSPRRVVCVVGTRPEAIKMAPLILQLRRHAGFKVTVLASSQHREMLRQALAVFHIEPDLDLDLMQPDQTLGAFVGNAFHALTDAFAQLRPDCVVAQGDTGTVLVAAMSAFFQRIPFFHVEAGLRSGDLAHPFPEEFNRIVVGRAASLHFAPTTLAEQNLLRENVDPTSVVLTGNTVVDALRMVASRNGRLPGGVDETKRTILLTVHRRENFGPPLEAICRAVRAIADEYADVQFVLPVHPNPNVRAVVTHNLAGHAQVLLVEPLAYEHLVAVLSRSHLVLTDSGGIQEEAPTFGCPVLVLREVTERPEGIDAGVARLTGSDFGRIVVAVRELLSDPAAFALMSKAVSPYGDGHASERIVAAMERFFVEGRTAGAPGLSGMPPLAIPTRP